MLFFSVVVFLLAIGISHADLSCSIQQTCSGVTVFTLKNGTGGYKNAHASLSSYPNKVCCSSSTAILSQSCDQAVVLRLYGTTNSHVQGPDKSSYPNPVCLSSSVGQLDCYANSTCGSHTCVTSISSSTNAHAGTCDEYSRKICCHIKPKITSVYPNQTSVYRTRTVRIYTNGTDDNISSVTTLISIGPTGSSFYITNATMTYAGSGQWYYDFTPDKNNETGYYDVEIYMKDDDTIHGYDYNFSSQLFFIVNNKPIIHTIYTIPANSVVRGNPINIYCNVSDMETATENLTVNISVKYNLSGYWNIFDHEPALWNDSKWYLTWNVPVDEQPGNYTVRCDAKDEDNDTGQNTSVNLFRVGSIPKIYDPAVSPLVGGWSERFDFSAMLEEDDGDNVNVTLWLNKTGAWENYGSYSCSNCISPTQINFSVNSFECANIGNVKYKFTANDNRDGPNETTVSNFTIEQDDVSSVFTGGNETTVGTRGPEYTNITFTVSDQDTKVPGAGLNVVLYVDKDHASNFTQSCVTNSTGSCKIHFDPDCSYYGGWHNMWAVISDNTCYKNNTGTGRIYIDATVDCYNQITLLWNYGDTGSVGGEQAGYYDFATSVPKYICLKNTTTNGVSGLVYAGNSLYYMNLTGSTAKLSQIADGNKFIIPIINGSCSYISNKMDIINMNKFIPVPFVPITGSELYVELSVSYSNINLVGEKTSSGNIVMTFTKGTGDNIIVS